MPLTEQQLQAIPVLDWLLSADARRTGRSAVIAICLVRRAAADPGRNVNYGDLPYEISRASQISNMRPRVESLIASDPRLSPHVTYNRDFFRLELASPIRDWMPPERATWPAEPGPPGPPPLELGLDPAIGESHSSITAVDYAAAEMRIVAQLVERGDITQEQVAALLQNGDVHEAARRSLRRPRRPHPVVPREGAFRDAFERVYNHRPPAATPLTTRPLAGFSRTKRGGPASTMPVEGPRTSSWERLGEDF